MVSNDTTDNKKRISPGSQEWWAKLWAQRQEVDWNAYTAALDIPSSGIWSVKPIDNRQRSRMHWLGHSDAWIDMYLRNWAEAVEFILQRNFAARFASHHASDLAQESAAEPTEEELQTRERNVKARKAKQIRDWLARQEAETREHMEYLERECQEPVLEWQHSCLRDLGMSDAWIIEHVHNRLEARNAIDELQHAAWERDQERERAETEEAVWLDVEVPESHVFGELVADAKDNLRLIEQVLQLPPMRLRWFEEVGWEEEVSEAELSGLCDQWSCDLATLRSEHLCYHTGKARRDPETGQLHCLGLPSRAFGSIDPDHPNTIRLSAHQEMFAPWREADRNGIPSYELWDEEILDTDFDEADVPGDYPSVREILAEAARRIWQERHFEEELLDDEDLMNLDAHIFTVLTVTYSAYARIRGRRWFEEFVERFSPFKAEHGSDDGAEDAA